MVPEVLMEPPAAASAPPRRVFAFGGGMADEIPGGEVMDLLGGKGAGLAEMSRLGLPVPPGFTVCTEVGRHLLRTGRYPDGIREQVGEALRQLEVRTGQRFGDASDPLLVAVRSGAAVSMPGMMDTVLNLGLNDATVEGLARRSGDPRFAFDTYRRFIQMFGAVVLGLDHGCFEDILEQAKLSHRCRLDGELDADACRALVRSYLAMVERKLGQPFPQDPVQQLWQAVGAVFRSWDNRRAVLFRRLNGVTDGEGQGGERKGGTAVTVQAMVFGNRGADSGTGVAFTRDPSTGDAVLFGEFLPDAQGEDLVSGIRTPQPLARMAEDIPPAFDQLKDAAERLEAHCRDMQDIEFTVQQGRLFLLQTRSGKRTVEAAVRIAVHMAEAGMITPAEAVGRVDADSLRQLLHPVLDPSAPRKILGRGLAAAPGAVSGRVAFSAAEAVERAARGETVILCRAETDPEDIHGIHAATGVLTARGGMTSHAAVVARGMGRTCVVAVSDLVVDRAAGSAALGGETIRSGDVLTLDGSTGEVLLGAVPTVMPALSDEAATLIGWADELKWLGPGTDQSFP
ncbi:pyruvate, phosphate dikinase (plasmid) [Skermanella mucosa]|uniref:pyruvate, phosphate dikinase n=1 Tax=Skermanella mucosa TaxID=1789672 RepID=UPI001E3974DC|nr:pyruvate, phosphate dikinase [Skermanella mucosa]UEM25002.1 pyruvate, phosphate dikinase [Skermanella mucosa]